MSGVEAALLAATTETGSGARRRRWLRRYGLASLGAVVIALWASRRCSRRGSRRTPPTW